MGLINTTLIDIWKDVRCVMRGYHRISVFNHKCIDCGYKRDKAKEVHDTPLMPHDFISNASPVQLQGEKENELTKESEKK